jgi:hypothetical protein
MIKRSTTLLRGDNATLVVLEHILVGLDGHRDRLFSDSSFEVLDRVLRNSVNFLDLNVTVV